MAERSWRTWLAGHRRTRLVLGKGTGIGRLWTSWKSRRLRNSWAGLGVDRSRRTRSLVKGGHGGYWEQVPRKGWRKGHADLGLGKCVFGKGGSGFGIGGSGCVWGCGSEFLVGQVLRRT